MALRRAGVSEEELGLPALRTRAERALGAESHPFLLQARVRLAVV